MGEKRRMRIIRWMLSVLLVATGLMVTWAWGQVAGLAPAPAEEAPQPAAVYAVWQPEGAGQAILFRSTDEGASWESLVLPEGGIPVVWADDGGDRLAVVTGDGSLLQSGDRGDNWTVVPVSLPILSLAWGEGGSLYLGTEGQGVYHLTGDGTLTALATGQVELATAPVVALDWVAGRLFAATPTALFYADGQAGGEARSPLAWTRSLPILEGISTLLVVDRQTVYVGTQIAGVYRSTDAGQSWRPAWEGLGLAAGQMVSISALEADPQEPGVLYAAVDHIVGSTQVQASAAGLYVSVDGGSSWQPLAGPVFPEARHASALLVVGRPLSAQAVTDDGLQSYVPDVAGAMAALQSEDARERAAAARLLGLAQATEAGGALLSALEDADPAASRAAADALGRLGGPDATSGLLVALDHPHEQVRLGAARALGALGAEAAVGRLGTMLLQGEGLEVSMAAEALGRIGSPAAVDALATALADPIPTPRWHASLAALEAAGEAAVEPVAGMLDSQKVYVRRNAALALGWIGSPSATEALAGALQDGDASVRQQAAWALGEIGDPAARPALEIARVDDASEAVQVEAARALTRLPVGSAAGRGWATSWAPVLNRLEAVRWLILALFLAGALWLGVGGTRLVPVPLRLRAR